MLLNLSFDGVFAEYEDEDVLEEFSQHVAEHRITNMIQKCYLPMFFTAGCFLNVLLLVFLIRRRFWRQHEGHIYMAAVFVSNIIQTGLLYTQLWLSLFDRSIHISNTTDFFCKLWTLLTRIVYSSSWLTVAMLANVCFRHSLQQALGSLYSVFAEQFCTVFVSKVVLGLILTASVLIHLWNFAIVSLHNYESLRLCFAPEILNPEIIQMKLVSDSFSKYLPVFVLIPILWLIIICIRRRTIATEGLEEEFTKVNLWYGPTLFVLMLLSLLYAMYERGFIDHTAPYPLFFTLHLISGTYPIFMPIFCLVAMRAFREDVKSLAAKISLPWWRKTDSENSAVIQLDSVEEHSQDEESSRS